MERDKSNLGKIVNNKVVRVGAAVVATTVAAERLAVRAGFDPLAGTRNVADELVVKDAHRAYDQIVDILPDADEAEAQTPPVETNVFPPSNLNGWGPLSLNGGLLTFVGGTSHLDTGSANFTTTAGGGAEASLGTSFPGSGIDMANLTKFQYWSLANTQAEGNAHPLLLMNVNTICVADNLYFDPNEQPGGSQFDTWQLHDGKAMDAVWHSRIRGENNPVTLQGYADFITFYCDGGPGIFITDVQFKIGPTSSAYNSYLDQFELGANPADVNDYTTYDFEESGAVIDTPTSTPTETPTNTATNTPTPTETPIPPTITPTGTATNTVIPGSPPPSVGGIAEWVDPATLPKTSEGGNSSALAAEAIAAGVITAAGAAWWINRRRGNRD